MTMSPGEIQRKVRQLDNDMEAIYGLIAELTATTKRHTNRLDSIDHRLDGIDGRLDTIDGQLRQVLAVLGDRPEN